MTKPDYERIKQLEEELEVKSISEKQANAIVKELRDNEKQLHSLLAEVVGVLKWYSNSRNYCYDKKSKHISTGYEDGAIENNAKQTLSNPLIQEILRVKTVSGCK